MTGVNFPNLEGKERECGFYKRDIRRAAITQLIQPDTTITFRKEPMKKNTYSLIALMILFHLTIRTLSQSQCPFLFLKTV